MLSSRSSLTPSPNLGHALARAPPKALGAEEFGHDVPAADGRLWRQRPLVAGHHVRDAREEVLLHGGRDHLAVLDDGVALADGR